MTYQLRPYQQNAINAALNHIRYRCGVNGIVVAPGGSGKSVMIAKLAERLEGKRIVIIARSERLLTQNRAKFGPEYADRIGIYCAGLGEKDLSKSITIATIQSIARADHGLFDIALVDECHNISNNPEDETQYWQFLKAAGHPVIIGFTATAFRQSGNLEWGDTIAHIPLRPLIDDGHIVPPVNKATAGPDLSNVSIRLGDYVESQLEEVFVDPELLAASVAKIREYSHDRKSVLIFTQSRKHSTLLQLAMQMNDMPAIVVDGETPTADRADIYARFEAGHIHYLLNCRLLTEGFDAPNVDMVVILRSTVSKVLFEQMVYRGTRPYPGKDNFLLLDMGGNLSRHGGLGSPCRITDKKGESKSAGKICPTCETYTEIIDRSCADCGYEWPLPETRKHDHNFDPDTGEILHESPPVQTVNISTWTIRKHTSRKTQQEMLCVSFFTHDSYKSIDVYLAPHSEHDFVRGKAEQFFRVNGYEIPHIHKYQLDDIMQGFTHLTCPTSLVLDYRKNSKFPDVVRYVHSEPEEIVLDDEIPF